MRERRPHPPMRQLWIGEQLGDREHRGDPQSLGAQQAHDLVPLAPLRPRVDTSVELGARRTPPGGGRGAVDAGRVGEHAPPGVVPHAQRDPPIGAGAAVDAVRGGHRVGVAGAAGDPPVRGELEDRRCEELEAGLVLRKVDRAADPRALPPLERREHRDRAVSDGDVIDVWPVQEHRRRVGLAEELHESGERAQLASVSRMERVRPGLTLVAARQEDELGVLRAKELRPEPESSDGPRREALHEDISPRNERARERHALGMLEVQRRAPLAVVVEREHPGAVGFDDAALERRVRRAEDVGRETALDADHFRSEVREVLPHQRTCGGEAHLDDPHAGQRARWRHLSWCGGSRRELTHIVPAARRRVSSVVPTPTSE